MDVRRLYPADMEQFRTLRLESLRLHPDAYGSSLEEEAAWTSEDLTRTLANGIVWGGFLDGEAVGIVGFFAHGRVKTAHKGVLWGMYVREPARGSGIAGVMVDVVIAHASTCVEILQLSVTAHNARARRLYERHGFVPYGIERRSLRVDDAYYDEELMALELIPEGAP